MRNAAVALALALLFTATAVASAHAEEDNDEYARAGSFEIGGTIDTSWNQNLFTLDIGPTLGFFVMDRLEMSLITRIGYENREVVEDERVSVKRGSIVLEPSYHFPIRTEGLYAFFGVGVGAGYNGEHPDLEIVPRLGFNIGIGNAGELSPALRMPILIGKNHGLSNDDTGVLVGMGAEIAVTTTF